MGDRKWGGTTFARDANGFSLLESLSILLTDEDDDDVSLLTSLLEVRALVDEEIEETLQCPLAIFLPLRLPGWLSWEDSCIDSFAVWLDGRGFLLFRSALFLGSLSFRLFFFVGVSVNPWGSRPYGSSGDAGDDISLVESLPGSYSVLADLCGRL